jgi:hypothetical protein
VEIEFLNRSVGGCDRYCREWFELISGLRVVLLLEFFRRMRRGENFACLAILYRRNEEGGVFVVDVVSFGSASLDSAEIDESVQRQLPLAPVRQPGVGVLPTLLCRFLSLMFYQTRLTHARASLSTKKRSKTYGSTCGRSTIVSNGSNRF